MKQVHEAVDALVAELVRMHHRSPITISDVRAEIDACEPLRIAISAAILTAAPVKLMSAGVE